MSDITKKDEAKPFSEEKVEDDSPRLKRSGSLSSIVETTRLAWDRVRQTYNSGEFVVSWRDIMLGFHKYNPLGSRMVATSVSAVLLGLFVTHYTEYNLIPDTPDVTVEYAAVFFGCAVVFIQCMYLMNRTKPVYILDFATYKAPPEYSCSPETFMELSRAAGVFSQESLEFQEKLCKHTGLGPNTAVPDSFFKAKQIAEGKKQSDVLSMATARAEAEEVLYTVVQSLLDKQQIKPENIDILIVNCSLFSPTPSMSAMVVNKFKMRHDVKTYNLSGMGCSAGLISVDLAKDLLQVHRNVNCLILSTENITQNWYLGRQKSMLLTNTLFRMGGAAILLSNKSRDSSRAKYELQHTVRTHQGASDLAYESVYQAEDSDGTVGVRLSKKIMDVSGVALRQNITTLGPLILPWSEQIKFVWNFVQRKWLKQTGVKPYLPNFKGAVEHFAIHTGGRAVIDTLEEVLALSQYDCEPSRFALYRFGNTSSASVWYELEFMECDGRMKKGDQVWQIAFGSGFKCNSAVWKARRTLPKTGTDY
ncbi:hypothetical protein SARC_06143 [Sphaeroforma arctica JP610]|uniref:3-ketoacyl-CoA synthase n=1 Tax=Sphaeroforma arctica JP610 TaxID=667725 RepID=A0A0L0FY97_9EUKA|nr:hypothetical protein SARC_06143 [Sphaeroforma arctica JP610]KNC81536.1 hypothetical protein SARC_06143 [Sphaeroforma arctica JP610]|eukprot:XP_014155438.1 hypothetical protein SARC_06143 [Sphaeroforma arctica JP610]